MLYILTLILKDAGDYDDDDELFLWYGCPMKGV